MTSDFWSDGGPAPVRYGGTFTREIIERAEGSFVYDRGRPADAGLHLRPDERDPRATRTPDIVATVRGARSARLDHLFSGML